MLFKQLLPRIMINTSNADSMQINAEENLELNASFDQVHTNPSVVSGLSQNSKSEMSFFLNTLRKFLPNFFSNTVHLHQLGN